jgi:hypothetical protein
MHCANPDIGGQGTRHPQTDHLGQHGALPQRSVAAEQSIQDGKDNQQQGQYDRSANHAAQSGASPVRKPLGAAIPVTLRKV